MAPQRSVQRPIRPGCSFGLRQRVGTLGLIVYGDDGPLMLSSSHVCNRHGDGRRYRLYQPAGPDGKDGTAPVAHAQRFVRLHPSRPNWTEAAVARPLPGVELDPTVPGLERAPRAVATPRLGAQLWKWGRTTGLVQGRIESVNWQGEIRCREGLRPFARQIVVRAQHDLPISLEGDSGGVWFDEHGDAVAMNFAGAERGRVSIASPLSAICERLRVRIEARP